MKYRYTYTISFVAASAIAINRYPAGGANEMMFQRSNGSIQNTLVSKNVCYFRVSLNSNDQYLYLHVSFF